MEAVVGEGSAASVVGIVLIGWTLDLVIIGWDGSDAVGKVGFKDVGDKVECSAV
jgi:hypothetical protein